MSDASVANELLQAYGRHFDARSAEEFAALFVSDATVIGPTGKEFVGADRIRLLVERTPPGGEHRIGTPQVIESAADSLQCSTPYSATTADGTSLRGTYEDTFVATETGWRIKRHVIGVG
jgi:hypothetical protein